jgi:deazaflavin-dependent oxidoreductase (nitroreductase family)
MTDQPRYAKPGWFTTNVFNRGVRGLTSLGVSVLGSRELRIRGRVSGEWRTTPVNLLTLDGQRYLLAPRGVTQWVRNLRAAGGGELRLGRRVEAFTARELPDEAKVPVMREYLRRWKWEAGQFFPGLDASAAEDSLAAAAAGFPVFAITEAC